MYTQPYQIIKKYRGQYKVIDSKGTALHSHYLSKWRASQLKQEQELQDKALVNANVLKHAEIITGKTGHILKDWLYQTLIGFDKNELRLVNRKPHKLESISTAIIDRLKAKLAKD